jgi:hypothetical protein
MPKRPAAYARDAVDRQALIQAAAQWGWAAPVIYAADACLADQQDPVVDQLEAAVVAGRHDALLMPLPGTLGDAARLMRLLSSCAHHGVPVSFTPTAPVPGPPGGRRSC